MWPSPLALVGSGCALRLAASVVQWRAVRAASPDALVVVDLALAGAGAALLLVGVVACLRPVLGSLTWRRPALLLVRAMTIATPPSLALGAVERDHVRGSFWFVGAVALTVALGAVAIAAAWFLAARRSAGIDLAPRAEARGAALAVAVLTVGAALGAVAGRGAECVGIVASGVLLRRVAHRADAPRCGRPRPLPAVRAAVRAWPSVAVAVSSGAIVTSSALELPVVAIAVASMCGVLIVAFACRELGGGYKPLRVPLSARDRAAHQAFSTVLRSDVRLVRRVVRRSTDGAAVAVEAVPEWPRSRRNRTVALHDAAHDAHVDSALAHRSLVLAAAHVPAVLHTLVGGDPWISVPVEATTLCAALGPTSDAADLDGVMARLRGWPSPDQVACLDAWRDAGLGIHVDAWAEVSPSGSTRLAAFVPDVITLDAGALDGPGRSLRGAIALHRGMGRRSAAMTSSPFRSAYLIVDEAERPVDLGVLLSSTSGRRPDEYVRRLHNEHGGRATSKFAVDKRVDHWSPATDS